MTFTLDKRQKQFLDNYVKGCCYEFDRYTGYVTINKGSLYVCNGSIKTLPVKFKYVDGDVNLICDKLVSLEGMPSVVDGRVSVTTLSNKCNLERLDWIPSSIFGDVSIYFDNADEAHHSKLIQDMEVIISNGIRLSNSCFEMYTEFKNQFYERKMIALL